MLEEGQWMLNPLESIGIFGVPYFYRNPDFSSVSKLIIETVDTDFWPWRALQSLAPLGTLVTLEKLICLCGKIYNLWISLYMAIKDMAMDNSLVDISWHVNGIIYHSIYHSMTDFQHCFILSEVRMSGLRIHLVWHSNHSISKNSMDWFRGRINHGFPMDFPRGFLGIMP